MKAFYVFVLIIGVCLANEKPASDSNHPNDDPILKAPLAQMQPVVHPEKGNKSKVPVQHSESTEHPSPENTPKIQSTNSTTPSPPPPAPPAPIYGVGKWNVTDEKGNVCILLAGKIALNLLNETDNKIIKTFEVPSNAPTQGNCKEECIEFVLPNSSSLHLMFGKNTTTSEFYLRAIKANLSHVVANKTIFEPFVNESLHLFVNPLNKSYFCAPESENLVAVGRLLHLTLKVNDFQVQAFKNTTSANFDSAVNCEASHTPDVVPIIVGCALGILVVLVLVAYLISRRRSQSRGYLSM